MKGMKGNSLIVIENGRLVTYSLDDRVMWKVGRLSKDNVPDIILHSTTVSRQHGIFHNMDGIWFYLDKIGTNGTVYNGKHIISGIKGKAKPIMLNDKDVLIFGGGEKAVINSKTIWAMFLNRTFSEKWRVEDTKCLNILSFTDGEQSTVYDSPPKGTVIEKENGIAIYMGDVTYLIGDVAVIGT